MLLMLINLLARFCIKIDIVISSDIKVTIKHPFVTDSNLIRNLSELAIKINPLIQMIFLDSPQKRYDYVLIIGNYNRDIGKAAFINSDGWTAYINTEGNGMSWTSNNVNPIGAYSAACFGVAELFKSIFAPFQHEKRRFQRVGSLVFSAINYGFMFKPSTNPVLPNSFQINDINFISMGAINSAALYTLCSIPGLQIEATIVEPENLDVSNLNRYAFSFTEDAINQTSKIDSAANFAGSALRIRKSMRHPFEKIADKLDNTKLTLVGVDNVESRWAVQKRKPDRILCGGTTGMGDVQISSYDRNNEGACLGCFYPDPLPRDTMPTVSFVSILSGVLLAGEIIKANLNDHRPYGIKNNLNLSLLSSQYYQHKLIPRSDFCKLHCDLLKKKGGDNNGPS